MVNGAVLVQLDELLLDDLNISNVNDREVLLRSVADFTGVGVKTKTSTDSNAAMTSFTSAEKEDHVENKRCEPKMEAVKTIKNVDEDNKTTIFPAFTKLLPTIGEEGEGEVKIHSGFTMISSPENDDAVQIQMLKEKDGKDVKKEHVYTEQNVDVHQHIASKASGHTSKEIGLEDGEVLSRATQIVQVFSEENMCLRKQLEEYYQEIKRLKIVDKELRDTRIMYKDLQNAFINREHKEKAMRLRMEAEITQLQSSNVQLTDELKELHAVLRSENGLKELTDEINQKDDEMQQLRKERKLSKTSLQNLERMLKQKSSEILLLQQQLEKSAICKMCMSTQENREDHGNSEDDQNKRLGDLEQFHDSMMKSRRITYFPRSNNYTANTVKKQIDFDITTCVPVLVELLKEKDAQIVKLRTEIEQEVSRLSEITDNTSERQFKRRYSKQRYSALETEIRSLHVQVAEKDAQIKILRYKYGESRDLSNSLEMPLRIPSFASQSSVSSYQDSGIMATSNGEEIEELDFDSGLNARCSNDKEKRKRLLSDHCWFV